jgi:hypothetical protein
VWRNKENIFEITDLLHFVTRSFGFNLRIKLVIPCSIVLKFNARSTILSNTKLLKDLFQTIDYFMVKFSKFYIDERITTSTSQKFITFYWTFFIPKWVHNFNKFSKELYFFFLFTFWIQSFRRICIHYANLSVFEYISLV